MKINLEDLTVSKDKLFIKSENEWVKGWNEIEVSQKEPSCHFKGEKMTIETWFQILSFFAWTEEKFKSESQIRLYYNRETKKWKVQPFPQTPAGMTTSDENDKEIRAKFPEPWTYFGTGHHHRNAGAFQSGTDEANEKDQDGWHFTIGHLDKTIYDYHGRFSWAGTLFKANLFEWIEFPKWAKDVPHEIKLHAAYSYVLHSNAARKSEPTFPEEWKSVIKPKPKTHTYGGSYHTSLYPTGKWNNSRSGYSPMETTTEKVTSSVCAEVEEILFDMGLGLENLLEIIQVPEDEHTVHDQFMMQNLNISLNERGMDMDKFLEKLKIYMEAPEVQQSTYL